MAIGYSQLSLNPTMPEIRRVVNLLVDGKHNGVGSFTCAANSTTTTVTDLRVGPESIVLLSPTSANSASENIYVSAKNKQNFVVSHSNAASTDRTFDYIIIG